MILLVAILIGLAATTLRARLYHRSLTSVQVRLEWLVFTAVIPQIAVFQIPAIGKWIPEAIIPVIQISTMTGLLIFTLANLKSTGFSVLSLGLLGNLLVIALNKGWMPVSPETLIRLRPDLPASTWVVGARLALSKDQIMASSETTLGWLSDCLTLPPWVPYKFVFSVGDILIAIGAFLLLWSLSRDTVKKEVYESNL
jgi:hypothetical protein